MSIYTELVKLDEPSGVELLCDPIFFGPTGITFSEPVTMVFSANPDTLHLPSDMRMVTYKVGLVGRHLAPPCFSFFVSVCVSVPPSLSLSLFLPSFRARSLSLSRSLSLNISACLEPFCLHARIKTPMQPSSYATLVSHQSRGMTCSHVCRSWKGS